MYIEDQIKHYKFIFSYHTNTKLPREAEQIISVDEIKYFKRQKPDFNYLK